jgi:hypothetical protein
MLYRGEELQVETKIHVSRVSREMADQSSTPPKFEIQK